MSIHSVLDYYYNSCPLAVRSDQLFYNAAQNCEEAGVRVPCIVTESEDCRVQTSHCTSCSCAVDCFVQNGCCHDAAGRGEIMQNNIPFEVR